MASIEEDFALLLDTVSKISADLAVDVLAEAGIPALQHGPDFDVAELGTAAHAAVRGVSVYVPGAAVDRARAVLEHAWGELPADATEAERRACPKCSKDLLPAEFGGVDLFLCGGCEGLWLGPEELRKLKDEADPNLRWMDFDIWKHPERFRAASSDVTCPRCDVPLEGLEYGATTVQVDACPGCHGIWLDAHQFERIVHSLQDELAEMPTNELLAASLGEALEVIRGPESLASEWKDFVQVLRLLRLRLRVAVNDVLERRRKERGA